MLRVWLTVTAIVTWALVALVLIERVLLHRRDGEDDDRTWQGRPILSGAIVAVAYLVPIAAGVATSATLSRTLTKPSGFWPTVGTWSILLAASTAVVLVVDRLARRLLPLAALLKLSLLFPDRAPPRLAVARRAGSTRNLQHRLDHARANGIEGEPVQAAERILSLVGALHAHDRHTRGHAERVRVLTDLVADELKLPEADRHRLRWAALLHDIGKLHVSPKILNKAGKPNLREWKAIHRHPVEGAKLAAPLAPWLGSWAATIEQHHERWDGTGYPNALKGEQICLGARIVAVADSYEVMTAVRSYKKARSASWARQELTVHAGAQFDPAIVRAFLNISIGRLRWAVGPASWVAQLPFIGWLPRIADGAGAVTGQAAGVVGSAASAAVLTAGVAVGGAFTSSDLPSQEVPAEAPAEEEQMPNGAVPEVPVIVIDSTSRAETGQARTVDDDPEEPGPGRETTDETTRTSEPAPDPQSTTSADKKNGKKATTTTTSGEEPPGQAKKG